MRPPLAALALSLLLATAGCAGLLADPPSDPGAEAVVEDVAAHGEDVDTYRLANDISVASSAGDRVHVSSEGVIDRPARRMRLVTTRDGDDRTVYVVGNTSYTECAPPWDDAWGVEEHDGLDDDWRAADPLARQLALLAESPVTWVANETVDGEPVHVVRGRPTARQLRRYRGEAALFDPFGPGVEDPTITAWIDADDERLRRTVLAFTVDGREGEVDARLETTFSGYGEDANVTLPPSVRTERFELGCPGT